MASVFSKIVNREIPAHIIAENTHCLAFLDINPLVVGHCLVVPKQEVDYFFDLPDELYTELMLFAKYVSGGIKKSITCLRVGVSVVGLEIPHAHVHLIPMNNMDDMNFSRNKLSPGHKELDEIATLIKGNL
ncbi:MAG TPA: HIT family protein [Cyclobacteriaceae bacterium]